MKAALLPLVILISSACREETISRVRVPKEGVETLAASPAPAPERGLRWSRPEGWRELPASGMRRATFIAPVEGKLEITVTAFPGDTGGELANVNRWRGQIGLPPADAAGLASGKSSLKSPAGPVALYDFVSTDGKTRLAAGVLAHGGMSWFFKASGDSAAVAAALPGLKALLGSLRADGR